jgi:hypothetical protein
MRRESALIYVFKDDTAVPNSRFEYGIKPLQATNSEDKKK